MKELSEKSETEKVEPKEAGNKVENGENKEAGNKVENGEYQKTEGKRKTKKHQKIVKNLRLKNVQLRWGKKSQIKVL